MVVADDGVAADEVVLASCGNAVMSSISCTALDTVLSMPADGGVAVAVACDEVSPAELASASGDGVASCSLDSFASDESSLGCIFPEGHTESL